MEGRMKFDPNLHEEDNRRAEERLRREDLEKRREAAKRKKNTVPTTHSIITNPTDIDDPQNWIILEGRDHRGYFYGDMNVCMHRLGLDERVKLKLEELGFYEGLLKAAGKDNNKVQNPIDSAEELGGRRYLGYVNSVEARVLNLALGKVTLNPRQMFDLRLDLESALGGKKKIHDARGREIGNDRIRVFYNEMFEVRNPWKGEWLDAEFKKVGNKMHILYDNKLGAGNVLVVGKNEELGNYFDSEGEWKKVKLSSFTKHGLPTEEGTDFHYWAPSDGNVAGVFACSGGFCFGWHLSVLSLSLFRGTRGAAALTRANFWEILASLIIFFGFFSVF
jgi:hypothetical protein